MVKELRTVLDGDGVPELEIVKEDGMLVIYEADDLDQKIQLPVSLIPALMAHLDSLK